MVKKLVCAFVVAMPSAISVQEIRRQYTEQQRSAQAMQNASTVGTAIQQKNTSVRCARLIFSTLQQLTFGHGYFRIYTGPINQESRLCRACHRPETPKHLLMECRNNNSERHELRKNLGSFELPTLLTTKKDIENTIQYLQKTRIATRKWILGEAGMAEDDARGWEQLEQD